MYFVIPDGSLEKPPVQENGRGTFFDYERKNCPIRQFYCPFPDPELSQGYLECFRESEKVNLLGVRLEYFVYNIVSSSDNWSYYR